MSVVMEVLTSDSMWDPHYFREMIHWMAPAVKQGQEGLYISSATGLHREKGFAEKKIQKNLKEILVFDPRGDY